MKRICIIFGHYNTKDSFCSAIRDTFIQESEKIGNEIDLINLYEEKEQLPFYRNVNPPPKLVLDYRKRLEKSDVMFIISPCHNLRLTSITEGFIDWILHPKWFFEYKSLIPGNKYFQKYGVSVPGAMKGKLGLLAIAYGGPMLAYSNFSFFDNIPYRRIKKSVFQLGGMRCQYLRFFSVLPNMEEKIFNKHMERVRKLARTLK